MADADPVASLAVQVAALRGQMRLINKRLGQAGHQDVAGLAARLDELANRVDETLDASAPRGPAALRWDAMDEQARRAKLAELAEWVATVLMPWYPDCGLRDCWARHPQAIIELGNLWTEWRHIYLQKRPPIGVALEWHDRWLPNAMGRIGQITRHCVGSCATLPRSASAWKSARQY